MLNLDQKMFELFMLKQEFTNMVLVTGDSLSIALTESCQKVDTPIVLGVLWAVLNDLLDCRAIDLFIKQLLVVRQQLSDC